MHCRIALCSLSTGTISPPPLAHGDGDERAGHDERLLVGQRDALSSRERGQRRVEPGRADDGVEHDVDVVARRPLRPDTPGRRSTADAARRRSHDADEARARTASTCSPSSAALLNAVSAATRNRSRWRSRTRSAVVPIEPVDPRIATPRRPSGAVIRRPGQHDAPSSTYATGITKNRLSKRSRIPPCPGMMCELSFTPASRLSSDSARSPICAATLTTAPKHQDAHGRDSESRDARRMQDHSRIHPGDEHARQQVRRSRLRPFFRGSPTGISLFVPSCDRRHTHRCPTPRSRRPGAGAAGRPTESRMFGRRAPSRHGRNAYS